MKSKIAPFAALLVMTSACGKPPAKLGDGGQGKRSILTQDDLHLWGKAMNQEASWLEQLAILATQVEGKARHSGTSVETVLQELLADQSVQIRCSETQNRCLLSWEEN